MLIRRAPCPALQPFVQTVWVSRELPSEQARPQRELLLPSGTMQLVLRLSHPLRVFADPHDAQGRVVGHTVLGGTRSFAHLRDVSAPLWSIGAQLRPGAGAVLLGVPAQLLAGRHTQLTDVWGAEAERMRQRLVEIAEPPRQLALFEAWLLARLGDDAEISALISQAVARLRAGDSVTRVVEDSGYSHRHFAARFERAVGLAPKLFGRLSRLQRALQLLEQPSTPWAAVALAAGYSDQPHFTREFRAFSGLTPEAFRRLSPQASMHVPLPPPASSQVQFIQDTAAVARQGRV